MLVVSGGFVEWVAHVGGMEMFLMEVCGRGFLNASYGVSIVGAAWIVVCRWEMGDGGWGRSAEGERLGFAV